MRPLFFAMSIALMGAATHVCAEPAIEAEVVAAVTFGSGEGVNGSERVVEDRRSLPASRR